MLASLRGRGCLQSFDCCCAGDPCSRVFNDINAGRYDRIVPQFATKHRHAMCGNHALAGERTTITSTTQWYGRLQRLLPDLRFKVHAVAVTGWPWHTGATVTWNDHLTLPDGSPAGNRACTYSSSRGAVSHRLPCITIRRSLKTIVGVWRRPGGKRRWHRPSRIARPPA